MKHLKLVILGSVIAAGSLLAGCTAVPEEPVANSQPVIEAPTNQAGTAPVTPVVQGDLEAADQSIDSQNLDTDFPPLNQTDLEK